MSLVYLLMFTIQFVETQIVPQTETENKPQQTWMIALVAVGVSAAVYYAEQQKSAQKKSEKEAKKMRAEEMAKAQQLQVQAGEYWEELSEKQMVLQQSENRFKTLADLLLLKVKQKKEQKQEILTTPVNPPAQQNVSIIDKINKQIDDFIRGR